MVTPSPGSGSNFPWGDLIICAFRQRVQLKRTLLTRNSVFRSFQSWFSVDNEVQGSCTSVFVDVALHTLPLPISPPCARISFLDAASGMRSFSTFHISRHLYKCLWCSTTLLPRDPNSPGNAFRRGACLCPAFPTVRKLSKLAFVFLLYVASACIAGCSYSKHRHHPRISIHDFLCFRAFSRPTRTPELSVRLLTSPSMLGKSPRVTR